MGLVKEFREFALKGNLVDMAVGIIIGVAFGKVVSSLVNDVIMPPIGLLLGGMDFSSLRVVLKSGVPAVVDPVSKAVMSPEQAEVAIRYGAFINTALDFLIVAASVFLVIRMMNRLIARREQAAA